MIATLIILILLVVFLAFLIGFNISNTCTIWFFKAFENVPVVTLVFIAFASGIILAFLIVLAAKLKTPSKAEPDEYDLEKAEKQKQKKLKKEIKMMEKKTKKEKRSKIKKDNVYAESSSADNTITTTSE